MLHSIVVMKVGPHSGMDLLNIIESKREEERVHGVHYWGYSGNFCQPQATQNFCKWSVSRYGMPPVLVLIETKSAYSQPNIGKITKYSIDKINYSKFKQPVQLQGATFSFVTRNLREYNNFSFDDYIVYGGKNDGCPLSQHMRFRVNKSFAIAKNNRLDNANINNSKVLLADFVEPYGIWLES